MWAATLAVVLGAAVVLAALFACAVFEVFVLFGVARSALSQNLVVERHIFVAEVYV